MTCPNKAHPDWISLVDKLGERQAYVEYIRNNLDIPNPDNFNALEDKSSKTLEELFPDLRESFFSNEEITDFQRDRDTRINQAVENFLEANGISYQEVSSIVDSVGNKMDAYAVADMAARTVRVVQGYKTPEILGEEAGHFLVELLGEEHPLYQSMYNEVVNFDVYREVLEEYGHLPSYKANEKKLRKEAMGKLIGRSITDNLQENDQRTARAGRWWNRVLRYLKNRVKSLIGIETVENALIEYDPFGEAAQMILSERELEYREIDAEEGSFYALASEGIQAKVVNDIRNKHKVGRENNQYVLIEGENKTPITKRVTDRVKAWGASRFSPRGEMAQKVDELKAKYGTSGHQDIQNIIDRAIARRTGTIEPARQHILPADLYNTLEQHFNKFIDSFPTDVEFITEVTLYDPRQKEAGTVDFIAVYPDGSVSIYDWKFIDFGKKKEIAWYKEQGFNIQLPRYKEMLRDEYGVERFRHTRAIPISARYKSQKLVGLEIADTNIENIPETQEHLRPVPIHEEMTGDEGLDRIIESLLNEKSKIQATTAPRTASPAEVDAFRAKKTQELKRIHKAIKDIQLKHDLTEYIDRGLQLIKDLNASGVSDIDTQELLDLINIKLNFYSEELIGIIDRLPIEKTEDLKGKVKDLQANSKVFEDRILSELTARAIEQFGQGIDAPQKETGVWTRVFRDITQQDDPIIAAFNDLRIRSQDKTRREYGELSKKVDAAIEELTRQFPNRGANLYDFMLDEAKNGALTITGKYSSQFYETLERNRTILKDPAFSKSEKEKARTWLRNNTKFNETQFKRNREIFQASMERAYREYENSAELIKQRLLEYDDANSNNDSALANERNRNLSVVENPANFSDKYKIIASTPAMKNFYDLWMEYSNLFQDYTGLTKGRNFVWNVPNGLFKSIMQNGPSSIINQSVLLERFYARESSELGMIDENGKHLMSVPVYFSRQNMSQNEDGDWVVDNRNQSRDLGRVLLSVGAMAYNHKNMSEIESNSHLLQTIMSYRKTIPTNAQGRVIRNKLTNAVGKMVKSANTLEQFQDYINYYLYDKRLKHGDAVFKGQSGQTYSGMAIWQFISKTITAKALAFNPLSITANAVAGDMMTRMVGNSNRFFNNKDYNQAMFNLIPSRNKKAHAIIGYFDLVDGENYNHKSNNRNINWLTRKLTYDNLFIGQKMGDFAIRNGILIAMMKKYRVEDGKIVRLPKSENSPSLYDYIETTGKDINLKELDKIELDRFRDKVHHLGNDILGNNTNNDIRIINMSVGGRALMMFRSWLPRTFDARYGELRYNRGLDAYELGRYRSFFNQVWGKQALPLIRDMIVAGGIFGYGGKVGQTTKERSRELWLQAKEKDPTLTMTEEEYLELHAANLKMMMAELYMLATLLGIISLVAAGDDETLEQGSLRRYAYLQLERIQMEIMTYWNPIEFDKLMRNPIPATRLALDIKNFGEAIIETPYLYFSGQEDLIKKGTIRKNTFRMIPGLSGFEQIWSYIDSQYDKTYGQIAKDN